MGTEMLLAVLAFGTMGAVAAFAYVSVQRTEERRSSATRPSTLASDGPANTPAGVRPPDV